MKCLRSEFEDFLRANGWSYKRTAGSHDIWTKDGEDFLKFLGGVDPRILTDKELEHAYSRYLVARAARS